MDENLKYWFTGFEKAIARMGQKEKETLFGECGKNCADRWVLNLYKDLFNQVNGDLDSFFAALNHEEGVRGEVVKAGKRYNLFFTRCTCGLHNDGYIDSPHLCECSRQCTLYVFNKILPNRNVDVEVCSTILRGGDECKFSISMKD